MLVDTGAIVNIMPYSVLCQLGRSTEDLIKTNVTLSDFNGQASEAQGVLNMDLTVGSKTIPTSFFIVSSKSMYTVLLGRDWIHSNYGITSMMHQCLIQWDGDEVEVVHADDLIEISLATMSVWDVEDQEPISGISLEGCDRVEATKKRREAGLIHRPHRVDEVAKTKHSDALFKADPCDQPQKIKCRILMMNVSYTGNNHKEARSSSRPYISCNFSSINGYDKAVDLNDRPKLFLSQSLSICSDLADGGMLGYGFTSADELEEVDIGSGDKPQPTFISKKLDPSL
jgi:hypothetical protein